MADRPPAESRKRAREEGGEPDARAPRLAEGVAASDAPAPDVRGPGAGAAASASRSARPAGPRRQALALRKLTDASTVRELRQTVLKLVFGGKAFKESKFIGPRPELPGPMACALTQVSLEQSLARFPYLVCEKSDGERHLMLVTRPRQADAPAQVLLVDRSFSFFAVHGSISCGGSAEPRTVADVMARAVSGGGPTLLDGELVARPALPGQAEPGCADETPVFLVFDAVVIGGARVAELPLSRRLEAVGRGVRVPLRNDDVGRARAGLPLLPLLVMGKRFHPARDLRAVLGKVREWPAERAPPGPGDVAAAAVARGGGAGEVAAREKAALMAATAAAAAAAGVGRSHVSVYADGYRVNGNDGLVFTPEAPGYLELLTMPDKAAPGGAPVTPLLKWKPLLENTVDFLVQRPQLEGAARGGEAGTTVDLYSSAGRRLEEKAAALLRPAQAAALLEVMSRLGKSDLVVECMVDEAAAFNVLRAVAGSHIAAIVAPDRHLACALKASFRAGVFYSRWCPMRLRPEKTRANSTLTANSTLEALADSVTPEDIARAITAGAASAKR